MKHQRAASVFVLSLCAAAAHADGTLRGTAGLGWLAGCWAAVGGEPGSVELWTAPAAGTMFGVNRTVRQGVTRSHEFMLIRDSADGPVFTARPSGQAEGSFTAERVTVRGVVFHNPAHDFPQRVIYESPDDETLDARIEGQRNGQPHTIRFPMKRVACPGGAVR